MFGNPLEVTRVIGERGRAAVHEIVTDRLPVESISAGPAFAVRSRGRPILSCRCYEHRDLRHLTSAAMVAGSSPAFVPERVLGVSRDRVVVVGSEWRARSAVLGPDVSALSAQTALGRWVGSACRALRQCHRTLAAPRVPVARASVTCLTMQLIDSASAARPEATMAGYVERCLGFLRRLARFRSAHVCDPTVAHGDLTGRNVLAARGTALLLDFEYSHLGCFSSDVGKWIAQGGYLRPGRRTRTSRFMDGVAATAPYRLDIASVLFSALAWCGDYRWCLTASRRGRPEVAGYIERDIQRLSLLDECHWAWGALLPTRGSRTGAQ